MLFLELESICYRIVTHSPHHLAVDYPCGSLRQTQSRSDELKVVAPIEMILRDTVLHYIRSCCCVDIGMGSLRKSSRRSLYASVGEEWDCFGIGFEFGFDVVRPSFLERELDVLLVWQMKIPCSV
jgi:hypothetical protein